MRVATPLGLSCTLPPSCFTFFLPLLVSFVSRLGLVRLGSVLLGPQTDVSLSLRVSSFPFGPGVSRSLARSRGPSGCPCSAGPRPPPGPLDPLAGPHGYQPLVFTSGQLGGGFDKTTSKLKHPPASLRPPTCPRLARSSEARRTHGAARDREKEETRRERERERGQSTRSRAHRETVEARKEGPSTSRRTRTGGFVKTKAGSFVESRSKDKEEEQARKTLRATGRMSGSEEHAGGPRTSRSRERGIRTPFRWFAVRRFPSNKPPKKVTSSGRLSSHTSRRLPSPQRSKSK